MSAGKPLSKLPQRSAPEADDASAVFASRIWKERFPEIDAAMFDRAESALIDLSSRFDAWLADEIGKLVSARDDFRLDGSKPETAERLYLYAHNLKGLGDAYTYPVVTRIAASLCRLIEDCGFQAASVAGLIHAHIDAVEGVMREEVHDEESVVVNAVVEDLEDQVRRLEQGLRAIS